MALVYLSLTLSATGGRLHGQEAQVAEAIRRTFVAMEAGDRGALRAEYAPGARIFLDRGGLVEFSLDRWLDVAVGEEWSVRSVEIRILGRTAVSTAEVSGALRFEAGIFVEGPFRYSETRERQRDTWRIVQQEMVPLTPAVAMQLESDGRLANAPPVDGSSGGAPPAAPLPSGAPASAAVAAPPAPRPARATPAEGPPATLEIDDPPPPPPGAAINQSFQNGATIRAFRLTEPLDIDGVVDEAFYERTPSIREFVQGVPVEDGEPTELTEAWISFDDENVYVSARVWDSGGPESWIANEMRRDAAQLRSNDHLAVFFDTYYDRRNAVGLSVSPIGGFSDFQITNEGNPNMDWNPIWVSRTALFDGGWSVEMSIPFKSLRYRPGRDQVWGVQFRRSVLRKNEWIFARALPLSVGGNGTSGTFRVSMYATLVGIEAPELGRNLEVKPYGIAGSRTDVTRTPRDDQYADGGLDVKYGITENLTADFTVNTDFAQVEVDEQQVNLTRFNLSFPEKREFFLESRGVFDFGLSAGGGFGGFGGGGPGGGGGVPTLFYSRSIGLQGGRAVPILGGGRLTGKVGSFDVGLMSIQTDDEPTVGAESTNFSVARVRRDILGRSSIGALFQNRSKSLTGQGSNYAWGVDGFFGLTDDLSVLGYFAKSHTENSSGLEDSYRGRIAYDTDLFGVNVDHLVVGAAFNPEIGFVRRDDFRQTSGSMRLSPRPRSISWIRQITLSGNGTYLQQESTRDLESWDAGGQLSVQLENSDNFSVGFGHSYENLVLPARISGALVPAGEYSFNEEQVSFRLGPQRFFSANLSASHGHYYGGTITSAGLGGGRVEVTPQISVEPSVNFNWIRLPNAQVPGRYDQHVAVTRVTYTMSPRAYVSGLVQYAFTKNDAGISGNDTFSANFRFRWEWAPGSELFLVYTEDRNPDVTDRWSTLRNRGFVIKVNRLLRI
ncbi:MAG: hypothetical protein FJ207_09260 [Gemmatimonadetes bacterium]|nr:hypothetical protein [Gemmatimonadota bacterium]